MSNYHHPEEDFLRKLKVPLPTTTSHGNEDDIRENMRRLMPNSWTLSGNRLTGMTEMGPLTQIIPTDYILTGTDENGLPVLTKVVLS